MHFYLGEIINLYPKATFIQIPSYAKHTKNTELPKLAEDHKKFFDTLAKHPSMETYKVQTGTSILPNSNFDNLMDNLIQNIYLACTDSSQALQSEALLPLAIIFVNVAMVRFGNCWDSQEFRLLLLNIIYLQDTYTPLDFGKAFREASAIVMKFLQIDLHWSRLYSHKAPNNLEGFLDSMYTIRIESVHPGFVINKEKAHIQDQNWSIAHLIHNVTTSLEKHIGCNYSPDFDNCVIDKSTSVIYNESLMNSFDKISKNTTKTNEKDMKKELSSLKRKTKKEMGALYGLVNELINVILVTDVHRAVAVSPEYNDKLHLLFKTMSDTLKKRNIGFHNNELMNDLNTKFNGLKINPQYSPAYDESVYSFMGNAINSEDVKRIPTEDLFLANQLKGNMCSNCMMVHTPKTKCNRIPSAHNKTKWTTLTYDQLIRNDKQVAVNKLNDLLGPKSIEHRSQKKNVEIKQENKQNLSSD